MPVPQREHNGHLQRTRSGARPTPEEQDMTWLGKILAFVVMILALVWMYFTVNVYVTRTNWKNESAKWRKAYDEAIAARESEHRIHQSSDSAYAQKVTAATATI